MSRGIRSMAEVISLVLFSFFASVALGAAPPATFKAVDVPGTRPFSATVLDLDRARYVEEEFYVTGVANRYRIANPLETAQIVDGGHPYASRIIVRRPLRRQDFNGTVVVEWYNVTGGQDADIVFAATHDHLLREGYAFVAVSAQRVGVNTLRTWNAARYGALSVDVANAGEANNGRVDADALSYDIFGQVGAALKNGDGLGGLKPTRLIAVGESQSAGRLTSYYNSIQPLHQVYDGFLTYDRAGALRTDIGVKSISIGTEFTGLRGAPPADSKDHRWWEVAGASHMSTEDLEYMDPVHKRDGALPRDAAGNTQTVTQMIASAGCQKNPIFSRVPTGNVLDMGLEQLVAWIRKGTAPVMAPRLTRDAAGLVRNSEGQVQGGVRLPAYDAPIAENGGANSGPSFCVLAGYHQDFTPEALCKRYGSHGGYVKRVQETARQAERSRFLLPADALKTRTDAAKFSFNCPVGK
ncbi:MAG: alpha/beta hydrolase domain-containing protein [Pseudomonadota bacterium]